MAGACGGARSGRRGGAIDSGATPSADVPFHICTAGNASPYTLQGTNTYVVGRPEAVVIDPGPDDASHVDAVVDQLARSGVRATVLLLTHRHSDHSGAAMALARRTGAPVRGWEYGAPLADDDTVTVGGTTLRALYTPGHARDHLAFYWPEQGVLFSGDLILGEGTVNITPPGGSMASYIHSLERVAGLPLRLIAPGHGRIVRSPQHRIAQYLTHRRERERQIVALLAAVPRSVCALADAIYPDLDPRLRRAAEGTVAAHLQKLVDDQRVELRGDVFAMARAREVNDDGSTDHKGA